MQEDIYKIVEFDKYCKKCYHWDKDESETPCDECLAEPANLYSHKPVKYSGVGKEDTRNLHPL